MRHMHPSAHVAEHVFSDMAHSPLFGQERECTHTAWGLSMQEPPDAHQAQQAPAPPEPEPTAADVADQVSSPASCGDGPHSSTDETVPAPWSSRSVWWSTASDLRRRSAVVAACVQLHLRRCVAAWLPLAAAAAVLAVALLLNVVTTAREASVTGPCYKEYRGALA